MILSELKEHAGTKRYYWTFVLVVFISIVASLEPLFFGKIIQKLELYYKTGIFDVHSLVLITAFWLIFAVITSFVKYFIWQNLITKSLILDYTASIKKYCEKTLQMSMSSYLSKKIGSIYKLIDRGTDNKLFFLFTLFEVYIFQLVSILVVIIVLFCMSIKMAFITLSLLPVMIFLGYYLITITTPRQTILSKKWESIFDIVGNAMSNFSLFKTLTLQKTFLKEIHHISNTTYIEQMKLNKYWNISEIYTASIVMLTRIFVLATGIFYIQKGELSLAQLFVIFSYVWWIYFPLWTLFRQLRESIRQLTEVQRLRDEILFSEKEEGEDTGEKILSLRGNIQFQNVSFWYSQEKPILKNIDFSIQAGEKIALVGHTGSGKSTIVSLLLRFWEPTQWSILLDGENIQDIKKSSLRSHIWVVSQDNSLFNLSIEENLKFSSSKATKKQIEEALKNAEAHFVFNLPQGLQTVIGERGLKLSGWEKQRISIARLFLKNPEILILDEATSALDNTTEKKIEKALKKLMRGKTSIIIAHRLSTIQHVDRIFVLERGKIVETWNYEELIAKKWKFYTLAHPDKLILW